MDKDMVDSDTGLTAVKKFTEDDSWNCVINVCGFINNDWAFTTELEQAWSQVFGRFDSHKPSCFSWSCKADEIER
jgi:hypothetical protein